MHSTKRRLAALAATAIAVATAAVAGLSGTGGASTTPATGVIKVDKVVVGTTTTQVFTIGVSCDNGTFFDASQTADGTPWGTTLPAGVTCTVNEPAVQGFTTTYTGNPATIIGGQTVTVTVTNTFVPPPPPPSASPRTIGYWSNWNTCGTNGNQAANAARTGNPLLDAQLPISLGNHLVDTCQKGVAVFAAASGRFMENQLAAQLLAAEANRKVGTNSCIDTIIDQADALLRKVGYAGPPSSIIGGNHPDRAEATRLKDALDNYNNNRGCPV